MHQTELTRRKWPAPTSAGHKGICGCSPQPRVVSAGPGADNLGADPPAPGPETVPDTRQHSSHGAGELERGAVFTPLYVKIRARREVTYYIRQGQGTKDPTHRI